MLLDIRTIQREGFTILQKFGPTSISDVDENGYALFSIKDCEWQDVMALPMSFRDPLLLAPQPNYKPDTNHPHLSDNPIEKNVLDEYVYGDDIKKGFKKEVNKIGKSASKSVKKVIKEII